MKNVMKRIGAFLNAGRVRKKVARGLAILVVFATTYSLVLPAITKTTTLAAELDGVEVRVEAKGGVLPEETELVLSPVLLPEDWEGAVASLLSAGREEEAEGRRLTREEADLILETALDGQEGLKAELLKVLDISLWHAGDEIEPENAVRLLLRSDAIAEAENPVIVHLLDDGTAELMDAVDTDEDGQRKIIFGEDFSDEEEIFVPEIPVIPDGWMLDADGNLVPIPETPEVPEIPETSELPGGMMLDEDGNLVKVPDGMMLDVDGNLVPLPEGLTRDEEGNIVAAPVETPETPEVPETPAIPETSELPGGMMPGEDGNPVKVPDGMMLDVDGNLVPLPEGLTRDEEGNIVAAPTETPEEGKDPAETPEEGKDPVQNPEEGKDPVQTPEEGKDPAETPEEGKDPAQNPEEGKDPVETPEEGKDPAETPEEGKDPAQNPEEGKDPVETPETGKDENKTPAEPPVESKDENKDPAETPEKGKHEDSSINETPSESKSEETSSSESSSDSASDSSSESESSGSDEISTDTDSFSVYAIVDLKPVEGLPEVVDGMIILPEGAEIPEGYTQVYVAENNECVVNVYAPEGAVPEGAVLVAELVSSEANEAGGVITMDIRFELDGVEIEPATSVYVVINAREMLPEDADPDSVAIQHHKDADAETAAAVAAQVAGLVDESSVMAIDEEIEAPETVETPAELPENVEIVADSTPDTGVVEVAYTDVAAAFEVDGFSYFTITYQNNTTTTLTVHLVDKSGNEIKVEDVRLEDKSVGDDPVIFGDILKEWGLEHFEIGGTTYIWEGAHIGSPGGDFIQMMMYQNNEWVTFTVNSGMVSLTSKDIYLVYNKDRNGLQPQPLYCYVITPTGGDMKFDVDLNLRETNANEDGKWIYVGDGQVYGITIANGGGTKVPYGSAVDVELPPVGGGYDKGDGTRYSWYPDITIKGENGGNVTYVYEGNPHNRDALTYKIEWVRFADTTGNNVANGAPDANDGVNNWHLDGYAVLESQLEIKYYVLDDDTKQPIEGIGVNGLVHTDLKYDNGNVTANAYTYDYDKVPYGKGTVTEWYRKNSNGNYEKWDFNTPITDDLDLYGFLRESSEETGFTLNVYKTSGEGDFSLVTPTTGGLNGAEFMLYKFDGTAVQNNALKPIYANNAFEAATAAGLERNVIYRLAETKAPEGYNPRAEDIYFTVDDDGNGQIWSGATKPETPATFTLTTANDFALNVYNQGGYVLPSTGGPGIYWYTLGGFTLMMACALALVYTHTRRKARARA